MSFQLLVACAATNSDAKHLQELSDKVTSWPEFFNLAHQHGVLPLVYQTLKSHRINIPQPAIAMLTQLHSQHVMHHMQMVAELERLTLCFREAGIELTVIKGPVLSFMAYGDFISRQYVDLDFLVHEPDLFRAAQLLEEQGYNAHKPIKFLKNPALLRAGKDASFYNTDNGIKIELHWRLFEERLVQSLKDEQLYSMQQLSINNKQINTLQNESLILYLAMHGSKHFWERLEWVVDIDRLIHNVDVNWEKIWDLACNLHVKIMLLLGLKMANHYFATPLPEMLEQEINTNTQIASLIKTLEINMLKTIQIQSGDIIGHIQRIGSLTDTRLDAWHYVIKLAFSLKTADIYIMNLPKLLHFFYYFVRPLRLLFSVLTGKSHHEH